MKTPKTPIEFDYDLWTTEDGKCMVRVKCTGEQCEVNRETFRSLRLEEKRVRRSYAKPALSDEADENESGASVLSLDVMPDDVETPSWLIDPYDSISEVELKMLEEDFQKTLTSREKDVYMLCIRKGCSQKEYADHTGLSFTRVCKIVTAIRKKAKIFF